MAVRVAPDTNRYVDFARGIPEAPGIVRRAREVFLPFAVLAELRAGFACGNQSAENERNLTRFLGRPRVLVLYPDEDTTHHYARLFLQLRRQGTPIPTNDLWIAALVVQHGLLLAARDRHFDHLPQIPRIQVVWTRQRRVDRPLSLPRSQVLWAREHSRPSRSAATPPGGSDCVRSPRRGGRSRIAPPAAP